MYFNTYYFRKLGAQYAEKVKNPYNKGMTNLLLQQLSIFQTYKDIIWKHVQQERITGNESLAGRI